MPVYLMTSALVLAALDGEAYDRRTHGELTRRAFTNAPAIGDYLKAIGVKTTDVFDLSTRTLPSSLSGFRNDGTALSWMIEGSIREDDYQTDLSLLGCAPPDNPSSAIDRVRHHFFDPDDGRGLHLGPVTLGFPAPAWALGEQGRGFGPDQNQFSLLDARLYQLRSLIEAVPEDRERYTALLFRALGQVVHLVEDMGQPQHARNDAHPACENALSDRVIPEHSWYEDYIETRALGHAFRGRPTRPLTIPQYEPPSMGPFFSYFADFDRRRGLADFTGHNFLSAGTNLGGFPPCGGRREPPCDPGAYSAVDLPHWVVTVLGLRLEAPVRLLRRTIQDPITLAAIPDVALTSVSVWDQHLESRGVAPVYTMNVLNYDSISDVLLPRAAGYAAGLLEHFFAGRIDASVQPAGQTDPTILKLVARNTSAEAVDGVLLVYAEDAITRHRKSVSTPTGAPQPLGAVPTGVVLAGGLFPEVAFRPPFPAEKYVVVYHGKRLGPRIEDPPAGAVGAVMAQVLGGPRVEAIVPQGNQRLLRSVAGTFELPAATAGLELIQWSDVDNHFVGVTGTPLVTGRPAPDQVQLFKIERPLGSSSVPVVVGSDPPTVQATLVKTMPFPYGLQLPTLVDYVQHVRVRQPLVSYQRAATFVWQADAEEYKGVAEVLGAPSLDVPVDETVTFAERFPVVLDREHLFAVTAATPRPYFWRVLEIGQDERERLLAVVEVQFTRPLDADRTVTLKTRSEDCSEFEARAIHPVAGGIQGGGLIALVDVERGTVIGTTATSVFAPSTTEQANVFPLLEERLVMTLVGGPTPGTRTQCTQSFFGGDAELPIEVAGAVTLPPVGPTEFALPGLYRADVDAVAGTPIGIAAASSEFELVYAFANGVNKAARVTSPATHLTGTLTLLREGARMRPGSALTTEVLLRFDRPRGSRDTRAVLVRWDPQSPLGTRLAIPGELDSGRYRLAAATPDAVLLRLEDFDGEVRTLLADLATSTLHSFAGDITAQFALLPPSGLYGVASTHFHTLDTLAETALPPALAPGPVAAPSNGAYHVVVQE
jgi:hypothetical protein